MKEVDKYQVVPGLWIGSKRGDLYRERKILISKYINGDETVKPRIKEITDELLTIDMPRTIRKK
jgi:hypothetical protein